MSVNPAQSSAKPFHIELWECPFCDKENEQLVQHSTGGNTGAEKSLRLHLKKSSGNGHGTENKYPSGYSTHTNLSKYVTKR
jgi:hypothetical protein